VPQTRPEATRSPLWHSRRLWLSRRQIWAASATGCAKYPRRQIVSRRPLRSRRLPVPYLFLARGRANGALWRGRRKLPGSESDGKTDEVPRWSGAIFGGS